MQRHALHFQRLQHRARQRDHLGIRRGCRRAEAFHTELVEFAQPPRLRFFVAIAGGDIRHLDRQRAVVQPVLQQSTRHTGGAFRAQGDGTPALVVKGVHLFLHHIGGLAHRPVEQLGVFKHRRAHFAIAKIARHRQRGLFRVLPFVAVGGQHILRAANGFGNKRHESSILSKGKIKRG